MPTQTLPKTTPQDWDRASKAYTQSLSANNPMQKPLNRMLSLLHSLLPFSAATTILELGSGPGHGVTSLLDTYDFILPTSTTILASDFSPGMVNQVSTLRNSKIENPETLATKSTFWEKVVPLILDATALTPLLDSGISHIYANFVIFLTSDPDAAVKEAYRVLQPNGVLACTSWAGVGWLSLVASAAGVSAPELPAQWRTTEAAEAALRENGFRDVVVEEVETSMCIEEPRVWLQKMMGSGNPSVEWVSGKMGEGERVELAERFMGEVKKESVWTDKGWEVPGKAVVVLGRK